MRQVTDYYMVFRTAELKGLPLSSLIETVRAFGMERFAKGLMWVMKETMAMPREWMLWEPDEKRGKVYISTGDGRGELRALFRKEVKTDRWSGVCDENCEA